MSEYAKQVESLFSNLISMKKEYETNREEMLDSLADSMLKIVEHGISPAAFAKSYRVILDLDRASGPIDYCFKNSPNYEPESTDSYIEWKERLKDSVSVNLANGKLASFDLLKISNENGLEGDIVMEENKIKIKVYPTRVVKEKAKRGIRDRILGRNPTYDGIERTGEEIVIPIDNLGKRFTEVLEQYEGGVSVRIA